jgi:hypothetical protein
MFGFFAQRLWIFIRSIERYFSSNGSILKELSLDDKISSFPYVSLISQHCANIRTLKLDLKRDMIQYEFHLLKDLEHMKILHIESPLHIAESLVNIVGKCRKLRAVRISAICADDISLAVNAMKTYASTKQNCMILLCIDRTCNCNHMQSFENNVDGNLITVFFHIWWSYFLKELGIKSNVGQFL